MSAQAILDAAATKVGGITGIKRAYGTGAADASVATMVSDIADTPVALVLYDGFVLEMPERLTHNLTVNVYVRNDDAGAAYKALIPFVDLFVLAWRSDTDLGGTCQHSWITGGGRPNPVEVNGKPYLVLPVRLSALEYRPVTYTA